MIIALQRPVWRAPRPKSPPAQAGAISDRVELSGQKLSTLVHRKNQSLRHPDPEVRDLFRNTLTPALSPSTESVHPGVEERIGELEKALFAQLQREGTGSLPAFALRGFYCSSLDDAEVPPSELYRDQSLGSWRKRGYLSEGGGNFFVFHPDTAPTNPDDFLYLLFASCGSVSRYATREKFPVVLLAKLDEEFDIPANGGNDGIDGSFPWSVTVEGEDLHLYNLDVGNLRRGPEGHPGVPAAHVVQEIGAEGPPSYVVDRPLWDRSEDENIAYARWIYCQVLEYLSPAGRFASEG